MGKRVGKAKRNVVFQQQERITRGCSGEKQKGRTGTGRHGRSPGSQRTVAAAAAAAASVSASAAAAGHMTVRPTSENQNRNVTII